MTILISDISSWPVDVRDFYKANIERFRGWQCSCCKHTSSSNDYDSLIYELDAILRPHTLLGYHCTRLTNEEVDAVRLKGMNLQDGASLNLRLDRLAASGILKQDLARLLRDNNQANDANRAKKLWFCFYEPHLAGEGGIGRFFRSWGGEALYNWHESNLITGPALANIGTPCIIKARVPIEIR